MKITIEIPDDLVGLETLSKNADPTKNIISTEVENELKKRKINAFVDQCNVYMTPYKENEGVFRIYFVYADNKSII